MSTDTLLFKAYIQNQTKESIQGETLSFFLSFFGRNEITFHLLDSQGCQMVHLQTENPNLDKFWNALRTLENVDIFYGQL
jgi:hypothetical protein